MNAMNFAEVSCQWLIATIERHHDHERMRTQHALIFSAAVLLGVGCAHYPENARMKHYDPQSGYRFKNLSNTEIQTACRCFWHSPAAGPAPPPCPMASWKNWLGPKLLDE